MRIIPFIVSALITTALVFALNKKWGQVPPMGKFLSPQHGFWQNAEAADYDYSADLKFPVNRSPSRRHTGRKFFTGYISGAAGFSGR